MLSLRKPSAESIRRFLAAQAKLDFTYSAVGATANQPPAGYVVDHTRIKLGEGEPVFQAAKAALQRWEQFDLGWLEAWPPETPIQTGEVVAIMARAIGLWWLNACRIVYVVDESGPITQVRLRLRHVARSCGERRGAILDRVGPGRQQRVVRHPGVFPTESFPDPAWLSDGSPDAETIWPGIGSGHAQGCSFR